MITRPALRLRGFFFAPGPGILRSPIQDEAGRGPIPHRTFQAKEQYPFPHLPRSDHGVA